MTTRGRHKIDNHVHDGVLSIEMVILISLTQFINPHVFLTDKTQQIEHKVIIAASGVGYNESKNPTNGVKTVKSGSRSSAATYCG